MEDVIEVYSRPLDPKRPQVCIDEVPTQLIEETRVPIPPASGRPTRFDYEYKRNGTANLFIAFAPLLGWREVRVTGRRTAVDFAGFLRWLVEDVHGGAERVVLVSDNLNVHTAGSLYEAFEPALARRVAARVEWHYTPRHGSWLNVAESELAVLSRQCLNRRVATAEELQREVAAWVAERNGRAIGANWQFTTDKARVKLRHLYPPTQ